MPNMLDNIINVKIGLFLYHKNLNTRSITYKGIQTKAGIIDREFCRVSVVFEECSAFSDGVVYFL